MPKRMEKETIGGFSYQMESLGMVTQQELILTLARPVAAFLATAVNERNLQLFSAAMGKDDGEGEGGLEVSGDLLQGGAMGIAAALREFRADELKALTTALASRTGVFIVDVKGGGKSRLVPLAGIYDDHFDGETVAWLQWITWGVRMNRLFGNALERLAALRAEWSSSSPKESTGSSTDSCSMTG